MNTRIFLGVTLALLFGAASAQQGGAIQGQTVTPPALPPAVPHTAPQGQATGRIVPPPPPAHNNQQVPPPVTGQQYYVLQGNKPQGPISLQAVIQRIQNRQLKRESLVWKKGDPNWTNAGDDPGLKQIFDNAGPPPVSRNNRFQQFLVGGWQYNVNTQGIRQSYLVYYTADGNYHGTIQTAIPGAPSQTSQVISGKWEVSAMGNNRFSLKLVDASMGGSGSALLKLIDNNTLLNENQGYMVHRVSN